VITGVKPHGKHFIALEAAHIFPVAHIDLWRSGSWQQQINDDEYVGETGIHSIQNGILLNSEAHAYFDTYSLAINPDNDFKTRCFIDLPRLDEITIFQNLDFSSKYQPSRALLKHHFRMAVLLNMKGRTGYSEWDEYITPGFDPIAEISNSEQGKVRFETVIAGKLNGLIS